MVRYLFYTIGDLTYQSPLVHSDCESEELYNELWTVLRKLHSG